MAQKLRIGGRLIDLTLSADDFRNELFTSTSPTDFTFTSIVSHRAEATAEKSHKSEDTAGSDAALAALQSTLASLQQEKEAKQANITNSLISVPKNRYDAARKEKLVNKTARPPLNGARPASPHIGGTASPHLGPAPTSAPTSEEDLKLRAMRTPVLHLLAIELSRKEDIADKTHIPKADLDTILSRIGKQGEAGKWQLSDKAYRDLDVWKFEYLSEDKRKKAVDNAVRAYDRMRVGKDDYLWQMLLPKEERGKGKVLSRLQLGGGQVNRGLTPSYQPSPMPHMDGTTDSRAASAANTPNIRPSTPRPSSSTGDVRKRLLAKDPQKARAAEDAKEKKRKEREAAASDREGAKPAKKQATKKTNVKTNVKSEEFVHSSDDESEEEPIKHKRSQQSESSPEKPKQAPKVKSKAVVSTSSDSSDTALKDKAAAKATPKPKPGPRAAESSAVKPAKSTTAGKSTPQTASNLSAPNTQQKSQRSPSNPGNRPSVPSPLGAARPRVASDVSDRGAVGVQKVRQGAETPRGVGITNWAKKHNDSSDPVPSNKTSSKGDESKTSGKQHKPTVNGAGTPKTLVNGASHKTEAGVKRKAEDSSNQESGSASKHRKTDSTGSLPSTNRAVNGMAPSPNGPFDASSGSDKADSVVDTITYNQGVKMAETFQKYYVLYDQQYEAQKAAEANGEKVSTADRTKLLDMHKVLGRMKKEIQAASERENA